MKREDKDSSIILTVFSVIIFIIGMLLLAFTVLSFWTAPKNHSFYDFTKDHGSLIAGLFGLSGVAWLVYIQKKSTKEIIKATLKSIYLESIEIDKRNNKLDIFIISSNVKRIIQLEIDEEGDVPYAKVSDHLILISDSIDKLSLFMKRDKMSLNDDILLYMKFFVMAYDQIKRKEEKEFLDCKFSGDLVSINHMVKLSCEKLKDIKGKLDKLNFNYHQVCTIVNMLSNDVQLHKYKQGKLVMIYKSDISRITYGFTVFNFLLDSLSSSLDS